jgi:ABC-type bacteriocin/lantibiotic exporter with double-glycine peptidase domain
MEGKDFLTGLGIFFGIVAVILLVIFFFWYIVIGLAVLVCILFIGIIIVLVIVALILLFAIPYFAITKKPEVQEHASYSLNEVSGRHEEKGDNTEPDYRRKTKRPSTRKYRRRY